VLPCCLGRAPGLPPHAPPAPRAAQVFACTVGQKPSKAPFYLNDTSEVAQLLARLADLSTPAPPVPSLLPPLPQQPRRAPMDTSA
jgi:hypothetical protein